MLTLSLTGCGDIIEIRHESFILGMGIDRISDNQLEVSLLEQLISKGNGKGQGDNGGSENATQVLSTRGKSFSECIQQLRNSTDKRLTLEKMVFIVFGSQQAEPGLREDWDYIYRTNEIDQSILLFLAKKDAKSVLEKEKGKLIEFALKGYNYKWEFTPIKLWNFSPNLYSPLEGAYLPIIDINNDNFHLAGAGLFQGSKLTQRLNDSQTRLLHILLNSNPYHINLYSDNQQTHIVSLSRESRKMYWDRNRLRMDIVLRGPLIQSKSESPMKHKAVIEKQIAERIQDQLSDLVQIVHKSKSDLLGIGEKRRQKGWDTKDWPQKLEKFPVAINVKVQITYGYGKGR